MINGIESHKLLELSNHKKSILTVNATNLKVHFVFFSIKFLDPELPKKQGKQGSSYKKQP